MKIKNIDRKIEENGLVIKRCTSTYKQEFLNMCKSNNFKDISSPSEREINLSPTNYTYENLENTTSNVLNNKNNLFNDKKNNKRIIDDNNNLNKFRNKKKRKLGSFLFQSSVKRNFSPQILKTKIDFNLNCSNKHASISKGSQNFFKTNLSSNATEDHYLINNGSTKNILTDILILNDSINKNSNNKQIKSQSPIRKISDIDQNIGFNKRDPGILKKNIFNGSNIISYKTNSPIKSKNNKIIKISDNTITKNMIEEIHDAINDQRDLQPHYPMSPQITSKNNLGKNFSSSNILLNSQIKNKLTFNYNNLNKYGTNLNKNFNIQTQNESYKFLFNSNKYSNKNRCIRKSSNLNEFNAKKNTQNPCCNLSQKITNKYKINYTTKLYAEIKNKELTSEKNAITQKNSNLKVNIKDIKRRYSELNNNSKNYKKISNINNYSRNITRNIESHHSQQKIFSTNNYTTEDINKNINEINDSNSKIFKEKKDRQKSPKSPIFNKAYNINNNICNKKLISDPQIVSENNKIFVDINNYNFSNKHLKKRSNFSYNFSNNFKIDLVNKNVISKKISKINKNLNEKNSTILKSSNKDQIDYLDYTLNKDDQRKESCEDNLIEIEAFTKESEKNKQKIRDEINVEKSQDTSIFIDCCDDNYLLDSNEYETKIYSNSNFKIDQIISNDVINNKNQKLVQELQFDNFKGNKIEGPEDLHFFYVNIFQKKKNYAPKFDF